MTAKQAVFLAYRSGKLDLETLREEFRSIQVRKVGKDTSQIRFRDSESWQNVDDFVKNYRNKLLKDLADQVTLVSKVLSQEELLSGLPNATLLVIQEAVESKMQESYVSNDTFYDVVDRYNSSFEENKEIRAQLNGMSTRCQELSHELEETRFRLNSVRQAYSGLCDKIHFCRDNIVQSSKAGLITTKVVDEMFDKIGV